jgi:hypothetical protein
MCPGLGPISDDIRNDKLLNGIGGGLVSVESAKAQGMTNFIVVDSGHSMMRYDRDVADQTIQFLKHGSFRKENN